MSGNLILPVGTVNQKTTEADALVGGQFLLAQGIKAELAKLEQVAQNFENDPLT